MMPIKSVTENNDLIITIIQWGHQYLLTHGYTLRSPLPENVKNTPWSYLARFNTTDGYIYLKHTPPLIALESRIIQILYAQFPTSFPEVIAENVELNCFLMKDAGRPLRESLKKKFVVNLLCKAIDQFTSIQLAVADHVDVFLDIGVPDWRLDKLPDLYKQLLSQKDLLIAEGLTEIEISQLEKLLPQISNLCKKLSGYSVKQSIVQPDFQDNNTLLNEKSQNLTHIDLGEIVISHPFFSLINCLQQAKKHHSLKEKDGAYLQLMDACLENYLAFESRQNLLEAFGIAQILWFVYGALAGDRLMKACGKEKLMAFQPGKLKESLKDLMTACS